MNEFYEFYEIMNSFKSLRTKYREIPIFPLVEISSLQKRIFLQNSCEITFKIPSQTSQSMLKDIF